MFSCTAGKGFKGRRKAVETNLENGEGGQQCAHTKDRSAVRALCLWLRVWGVQAWSGPELGIGRRVLWQGD